MQQKTRLKTATESRQAPTAVELPEPISISTHKPVVVFLGNVGVSEEYNRHLDPAEAYARENPGTQVFGIDLRQLKATNAPHKQIRADFTTGMSVFPDGSVSEIRSEMSLGMFDRGGTPILPPTDDPRKKDETERIRQAVSEYTGEALDLIHRKLKDGGKIAVSVTSNEVELAVKAFETSRFSGNGVDVRELGADELGRSFYPRYLQSTGLKIFEITATKQPTV